MFRKMMAITGMAVLGLALTVAFADFAQARGGRGMGMKSGQGGGGILDRLDADGDGRVSRTEYTEHFDTLDADADGYVTREEIEHLRTEHRMDRRENRFAQDDVDGDGRVSRDEFSGPSKHFAKVDANNDGYITEEELQNFQPVRDRMGGPGMGQGPGSGPGGQGGPGMGPGGQGQYN